MYKCSACGREIENQIIYHFRYVLIYLCGEECRDKWIEHNLDRFIREGRE